MLSLILLLVTFVSEAQAVPPVTIATPGAAAGHVDHPTGVAIDESGDQTYVYVADSSNARIDKFDGEGNFLMAWGFGVRDLAAELETCGPEAGTSKCFKGSSATAAGGFGGRMENVAVEPGTGDVYATDSSNNLRRLTKFSPTGQFLYMVGKEVNKTPGTLTPNLCTAANLAEPGAVCGGGEKAEGSGEFFTSPGAIAVDSSGHVWVLDGTRVDQFDSDGAFVSQAPISGGTAKGLALDPGGDIYTIRAASNEQQEISFSGFAVGDTFTIGNLPGACSASSTDPIAYAASVTGRSAIVSALVGKCGSGSFVAGGNPPSTTLTFQGALAAQDFGELTCTTNTGTGGCSVSTIVEGAPQGVYRLHPSGSPVDTLTPVGSPLDSSGLPEALATDSAGNVYIGDRTVPYRFLKFNPVGEQTSQFGAGQVLGIGANQNPIGNALAVANGSGVLYVASGGVAQNSFVQRFTLPEEGPLPENERVSDLLPTTATLESELNPERNATTYRFEWGEGSSFDRPPTETKTLPGSDFDQEPVQSVTLTELVPDTEYSFRLSATSHCRAAEPSHECTVDGEPVTFTTPPAVKVDAQWATDVAATSATVHGKLDPLGVPAEWWVEYGEGENVEEVSTPPQPLGGGFGDVSVTRTLTGLQPGTTYSFRFAARDRRDGKEYVVPGPTASFRTGVTALGFTLPDSRAWEQVTPLVKAGGGKVVGPWNGATRASEDGNALTYVTFSTLSGSGEGSRPPDPLQSLARRGAGGWSSGEINPPEELAVATTLSSEFRFFSSDLSLAAVEPRGIRANAPSQLSEESSERTPYLRENFADPVHWRPLVTGKEPFANVPPGTKFGFGAQLQVVGASPDLEHVILRSEVPLTSDAEGVSFALYEWTRASGSLRLISELPTDQASEGALGWTDTGVFGGPGVTRHAVSTDGRYVYWSNEVGESPKALYLRDTAAGETVRLDVPEPGAIGGEEAPIFQGASADGTRAFFTDTQHLTAGAGEAGRDLYVCDVVHVAGETKCDLRDLTPEIEGQSADVQGVVSGIGASGDDVYYVANGALAAGASPGGCPTGGTCNLYHAHFDGSAWSTELVAVLSRHDAPDWGDRIIAGEPTSTVDEGGLAADVSPSGRYLVFMSQRGLTGYDNSDAASGEADEEVYRFDAAAPPAEALVCVSCNPSGARPRGVRERLSSEEFLLPSDWHELWAGRWLAGLLAGASWASEAHSLTIYQPRRVLDNGRVFFTAFDSLVPADSNGTSDAYQYEPHGVGSCTSSSGGAATAQVFGGGGGCVSILTSGTSDRESSVLDASASGNDVFILTDSPLSVLDEDPDYDIYDARVNGVAARRPPSTECQGETCQQTSTPPNTVTTTSSTFHGPGNAGQARSCGSSVRRAKHLRVRAKRLRRNARKLVQRSESERRARRMNRKAKRLAQKAKRLGSEAKRCRHGARDRAKRSTQRHSRRRAR